MTDSPELHVTNTHLYRGARLVAPASGFPIEPTAVQLVFCDGEVAEAELIPGHADAELLLAVPPHRTAAGQVIPAKTWHTARVERDAEGREIAVLGARVPSPLSDPRT